MRFSIKDWLFALTFVALLLTSWQWNRQHAEMYATAKEMRHYADTLKKYYDDPKSWWMECNGIIQVQYTFAHWLDNGPIPEYPHSQPKTAEMIMGMDPAGNGNVVIYRKDGSIQSMSWNDFLKEWNK